MSLGVVIIGRNEASNLPVLAETLARYRFDKIVYVDSNSSDASVTIARSAGWLIVSLLPSGVLSAATGRAVGTLQCNTELILYLDGDMQPNLDTLDSCIEYLGHSNDPNVIGITGDIVDIFDADRQQVRTQKSLHGQRARWFGGAVILKRQALLAAGNWNPNVYANEELELYARLRRSNGQVLYVRQPLVRHRTEFIPPWQTILNLLCLNWQQDLRNGGLGYAVRAAIQKHSLLSLLTLNPEPFVVPILTLLVLVIGILGSWFIAGIVLLGLLMWVQLRRGLRYILVCYLLFPQIFVGLLRYRAGKVYYTLHVQGSTVCSGLFELECTKSDIPPVTL